MRVRPWCYRQGRLAENPIGQTVFWDGKTGIVRSAEYNDALSILFANVELPDGSHQKVMLGLTKVVEKPKTRLTTYDVVQRRKNEEDKP